MELRWNTPQVHSHRCHARRTAGVWLVRDSFVLQTIGRGSFVGEAVGLHVADAARDYRRSSDTPRSMARTIIRCS